MKKRFLILPLLAMMSLTSCDFISNLINGGKKPTTSDEEWDVVPTFVSGTDEEKNAILEAVNYKPICINKTGAGLYPFSTGIILQEDNDDYIKVAKSVIVGDYTVKITWEASETQDTFLKKVVVDDTFDMYNIKYQGYGNPDKTFAWSISKLECGSAVSTDTKCNYTATVKAASHSYRQMTMEEIYANHSGDKTVNVGGTDYVYHSYNDNIDYEASNNKGYSPWWLTGLPSDTEDNYIFCEVKGKVIFLSDDGNWGLLANGDHVVEIYSGNQLDLNTATYPDLRNEYVTIKGELNHYYGNFQLSYIVSIKAIDKSEVTEPTMTYKNLSESLLASIELGERNYKQFPEELEHNALVSVTGTITGDKVDGSSGRFTFEMSVGTHIVQIAYDYHTDKNTSNVKNALLAKYQKGATVTIKGTYRFNSTVEKKLVTTDGKGGLITIAPFLVEHMA